MLPARKPLTTSNFFGKSYPRAIGTLGDEDHLVKAADGPQLPNAPFLKWAGTADWKRGGTSGQWLGKAPKEPITALEAYQLYLRAQTKVEAASSKQSVTAKLTNTVKKDDEEEKPDADPETSWAALAQPERDIFEALARDDARRFQEEATQYEVRNPGWFARRHERPQRALVRMRREAKFGAPGARARQPRPALTPWTAFLKTIVEKVKQRDPEAAATFKGSELMKLAMEQAKPIWGKMKDDDKADYVRMAEEDKTRYERELAVLPDEARTAAEQRVAAQALQKLSSAWAGKRRAKKAGGSEAAGGPAPDQGKKARKPRSAAPKKVDPKIAAKEAAEKVDTTGMTAMQAWAAKQRAMKQAAAAAITKRITRKAAAAAAQKEAGETAPVLAAAEEPAAAAADAAADMDGVDAAPALLQQRDPSDEAYIRSRATLEDGEEEEDSDYDEEAEEEEVEISDESDADADADGEDGVGMEEDIEAGDSPVADEEEGQEEGEGPSQIPDTQPPATQREEGGDGGVLGRVRDAIVGGLGWLTTGRKKRPRLMAAMQDEPMGQTATPRKLEASYTRGDLDEPPSSAAKRRRRQNQ